MADPTYSAAAAKLAMVEISLASTVIPAAWPIAQIVYFNQCDPETMMRKAAVWLDMYDALGFSRDDLAAAVQQLTAQQWTGEDRAAFESYLNRYDAQVLGTQLASMTVGTTVMVVSGMLLCLVIAYSIVSTILAAFALFIAAAGATVVGAPAAASALATANTIAAEAGVLLRGLEKMIAAVSNVGAGAIAGALSGEALGRLMTGDLDVGKDLVQAAIDGSDNIVAGFLSKYERDFVGYGIASTARHTTTPTGPGYLVYGTGSQTAPAGTDDEGDTVYGTGGVVDNIWGRGFGGDAWNH